MAPMSRSIRLIQSIGQALSRRRCEHGAAATPPVVHEPGETDNPWAERSSVTVRAVRRLARGTRPPTHGDSH